MHIKHLRLALLCAVLPVATLHAALENDIVAGDQRSLRWIYDNQPSQPLIFADRSSASTIKHVKLTGNDQTGDGSEDAPWRTLQYAVNQLQSGHTLHVHAGTYTNVSVSLASAQPGTALGPITVSGAPGETPPTLVGTSSGPAFLVNKSYWILKNVVIDMNHAAQPALLFTGTDSHHAVFRESEVRNSTSGTAIHIERGANNIQIAANTVHDTFRPARCAGPTDTSCGTDYFCNSASLCESNVRTCSNGNHATCGEGYYCDYANACRKQEDAHAVGVYSSSHSVLIEGNTLYDNSGDGMQCSGPLQGYIEGNRPYDITFDSNDVYTSPQHFGRTENAVDIKDCSRVTVSRNRLHGFRPTPRSRDGTAIVVHFTADQIEIEKNEIWDTCVGLATGNSATDTVTNLVFRRNIVRDLVPTCQRNYGLVFTVLAGADIYHNTFDNIPQKTFSIAEQLLPQQRFCTNIDIWNNIISNASIFIAADANRTQSVESGYNLFHQKVSNPSDQFRCNYNAVDWAGWQNCTTGGGLVLRDPPMDGTTQASRMGNPLYLSGGYYTDGNSPARDAARVTNDSGGVQCNTYSDIGATEGGCGPGKNSNHYAGIVSGAPENSPVLGGVIEGTAAAPVIAWKERAGTSESLFVQRWAGRSWAPLGLPVVSGPQGTVGTPSLALDGSGQPFVAWTQSGSSGSTLSVRRWNGTRWQNIDGPFHQTSGVYGSYQLRTDSLGRLVLAVARHASSSAVLVYRWDGSQWTQLGGPLAGSATSYGMDTVLLAVDASNTPVVAWTELDPLTEYSKVLVRRWEGTGWLAYPNPLPPPGRLDMREPSLQLTQLTPQGQPVMAFVSYSEDFNYYEGIFVYRYNGTAWEAVGAQVNDQGAAWYFGSPEGRAPQLRLAANDSPVLTWVEGPYPNLNPAFATWNGAYWTWNTNPGPRHMPSGVPFIMDPTGVPVFMGFTTYYGPTDLDIVSVVERAWWPGLMQP